MLRAPLLSNSHLPGSINETKETKQSSSFSHSIDIDSKRSSVSSDTYPIDIRDSRSISHLIACEDSKRSSSSSSKDETIEPSLTERINQANRGLKKITIGIKILESLIKRYSTYPWIFRGTMLAAFATPFIHLGYSINKFNQAHSRLEATTFKDWDGTIQSCGKIIGSPANLIDAAWRCDWLPDFARKNAWEFPCAAPMQALCDDTPGIYKEYSTAIALGALGVLGIYGTLEYFGAIKALLNCWNKKCNLTGIAQGDELTQGKIATLIKYANEFNIEIPDPLYPNAKDFFQEFLDNFQGKREEIVNRIQELTLKKENQERESTFLMGSHFTYGETSAVRLLFTTPKLDGSSPISGPKLGDTFSQIIFGLAGTRPLPPVFFKDNRPSKSTPMTDEEIGSGLRLLFGE